MNKKINVSRDLESRARIAARSPRCGYRNRQFLHPQRSKNRKRNLTMPKAQKRFGRRLTKAPLPQKNRRKQDGRPKGTLKRYRFDETRLGFMLRYEVPVVYDVLMRAFCRSPTGPSRRSQWWKPYAKPRKTRRCESRSSTAIWKNTGVRDCTASGPNGSHPSAGYTISVLGIKSSPGISSKTAGGLKPSKKTV